MRRDTPIRTDHYRGSRAMIAWPLRVASSACRLGHCSPVRRLSLSRRTAGELVSGLDPQTDSI